MNSERFEVSPGKQFKLRKIDPADTSGLKDRQQADDRLGKCVKRLSELQDVLYAHDRYAILLIFQAMDAAGKDSTVKHVMSGVNPQGCQVYSFKSPSAEDLDHDFMWRCMKALPERGRIGIFNRSYYEEVLVVRVHPEYLDYQRLPKECTKNIWERRFEDINNIERYMTNNGVIPIKFFLYVSPEEQKKRFLKRLDDPTKRWKFSDADVRERALFDKYMDAYEDMLQHTSSKTAPWYVIPADHKWHARWAVSEIIIERLKKLDLCYPSVDKSREAELSRIREQLASGK